MLGVTIGPMAELKNICVLGAGSWGTALANVSAEAGCASRIWGRDPTVLNEIEGQRTNTRYLPGILLNPAIKIEPQLGKAIAGADWVVCAIPTQQIRSVLEPVSIELTGKVIINAAKGLEQNTYCRVSEIFANLNRKHEYVILSGPSFAQEVASRLPTAVTVACKNKAIASTIQMTISTPYFRIYTATDIAGIELAGALKNIIAIAAGIVAGLRLGHNAQAAVINRGIAEMIRLGKKKGARPESFLGLAGVGDLILTCTGPLSRNRRLGMGLGEGKKIDTLIRELGGVAEGYFTVRAAHELAKKLGVEMPITEQIFGILYENKPVQGAVKQLMERELKEEYGA